ncbi:peptidase S8 [Halobacteriales archaeon QH_7_69_31]|nr:MAG: peptidase S8 [Halobacteriales archaeon QH_7_69_31]
MTSRTGLSRRRALQLVGGSLSSGVVTGTAAGTDDGDGIVRVNVGYASPSGRKAAADRAEAIYHDLQIDVLTIGVDRNAIPGLRQRRDIRFVEDDVELEAIAQETPWGIDRVDAEVAHANGDTGDGVDVAIIDTGIDRDHPDLAANVGEGVTIVAGATTLNGDDDNGHGTHCAGIADAVDNSEGVVGVSTTATLHPVKVLSATGAGLTSDVAKGIEYTADQGWDVGSLSLGGGDSQTLEDACRYAYSKNVVLVAAAGNDGPCSHCVSYPAAYSECMAVSATSKDDSLAGFSSAGPEVEIAAPGDGIYSTYLGGYETLSGTSMACPHVSGAAAQAIADGTTDNDTVRSELKEDAEDIGLSSDEAGAGLLDVAAVLAPEPSDGQ